MKSLQKNLKVEKTIKLFIGGEFPRTESGRSFPIHRKKSKSIFAQLCLASRKDLREAVTAAHKAFPQWSGKTAYNRAQILYRMAEMAEGKREEFNEALIETMGLTPSQANSAVNEAIGAWVYFAGWADKYQQVIGAVNPVSGPHHCFTTAEPTGVVGFLGPKKFNLGSWVARTAAILATGNTLVALLPEEGSALLAPLSEVFATSDLTPGAANLLTGKMDELKSYFGSHMEIQALACHSNDHALISEMQNAGAENMKRVITTKAPDLSLESLIQFVEFKTIWHPIGM